MPNKSEESLQTITSELKEDPSRRLILRNPGFVLVLACCLALAFSVFLGQRWWRGSTPAQQVHSHELEVAYRVTGPQEPTQQLLRVRGTVVRRGHLPVTAIEFLCHIRSQTGRALESHKVAFDPPLRTGQKRNFQFSLNTMGAAVGATVTMEISEIQQSP